MAFWVTVSFSRAGAYVPQFRTNMSVGGPTTFTVTFDPDTMNYNASFFDPSKSLVFCTWSENSTHENSTHENSTHENSTHENSTQRKFHPAKIPPSENSTQRKFHPAKIRLG